MYYLYIIYSNKIDQYYIGQSRDIENRIINHNNARSKSTRKADDWVLKYFEEYITRSLAMKREIEIKKKKSRKFIEQLIIK